MPRWACRTFPYTPPVHDDTGQTGEITQLLHVARQGENAHEAEARVVELAYNEMRRIAGAIADPHANTVNATVLVHEAWLKLNGSLGNVNDRRHFLALAARAMRQVMLDAARSRNTEKRGGAQHRFTLHDADGAQDAGSPVLDLADIHHALEALRTQHPRQAEVFELRAFGTLTFAEVADIVGISESSARVDWQFARASIRATLDPS